VKRGDRVRLVRAIDDIPAGSAGRIFGYLRRPEGDAFAVAFDHAGTKILEGIDLEVIEVLGHAAKASGQPPEMPPNMLLH
jgi:hypothetical protein